jgi:hypothetical protein
MTIALVMETIERYISIGKEQIGFKTSQRSTQTRTIWAQPWSCTCGVKISEAGTY